MITFQNQKRSEIKFVYNGILYLRGHNVFLPVGKIMPPAVILCRSCNGKTVPPDMYYKGNGCISCVSNNEKTFKYLYQVCA